MAAVAPENADALEAWDGVLFDRFVEYRDLLVSGLEPHGEAAIAACPPGERDRVLDIGCGFGDTTRRLAELVGPEGFALGVDIAPRFVEAARAEAAAGVGNVRFEVSDVQVTEFAETFDYAFSRFGAMFFAAPVTAFRNVRRALTPSGRLCIVVWRRKLDNPWVHRAENIVKPLLEGPEETNEPGYQPGPFSLADADATSQILLDAGFGQVTLQRCDVPLRTGRNLDEAVELALALGPAGEAIRLAGQKGESMRPRFAALLREALTEFETPEGIVAASSSWVVTARAGS
jgi:SAM-dependent methyltransferase